MLVVLCSGSLVAQASSKAPLLLVLLVQHELVANRFYAVGRDSVSNIGY